MPNRSTCSARKKQKTQLRSEDDSHPVERVEHERGEPVSVPVTSCHCSRFRRRPRIAKAAEGKYQVIDEGDLGMGPRTVGYFISGRSRLYGELGEYAVEGERGFESPEKPFTTTVLVSAGALNSNVQECFTYGA